MLWFSTKVKKPSPQQMAAALHIAAEVRRLLARAELGLANIPDALRELADRLEENADRNNQE